MSTTPYTPEFFQGVRDLSASTLRHLVGDIALKDNLTAAEGLLTWLESQSAEQLEDLGKLFWNKTKYLEQNDENKPLAAVIRLSAREVTRIDTSIGAFLAAFTCPREANHLKTIPTDVRVMTDRSRALFERSCLF